MQQGLQGAAALGYGPKSVEGWEVAERPRVPSTRYFLLTLERVLTEGSSQEGGIQSSATSAEDGIQGLSHARQTLCHWLSYKLASAFLKNW